MHIAYVEIQNFRKLKSVRIDLSESTTLLVGANNSGKTSAMIAMRHFLIDRGAITVNDFTLSNWATIKALGERWRVNDADGKPPAALISEWETVLPSLDVWIKVASHEVHFVRHLIPTLDWTGGLLGVRLRFEPKDVSALQSEFLTTVEAAQSAKAQASKSGDGSREYSLALWPQHLLDFLERRLRSHFTVGAYVLDPSKQVPPTNGFAKPQALPADSLVLDGDPFEGLILIHEIAAHRDMKDAWGSSGTETGDQPVRRDRRRLSDQLRSYYQTHLDPSDEPEPADIDALQAIEDAQKAFDSRLTTGFKSAIEELEKLNYPGIADPKLTISTRVRPLDGLNHQSAVRYEVACLADGEAPGASIGLPEDYNGLGFQNLISMVFKLMSFRDSWLKVGKAGKKIAADTASRLTHPPLHLVLVEEPEAHLHVQVQQVFVRKAYEVLRNHPDLKESDALHTQLVVSTHSSHVAHECEFACLRYFRRIRPRETGDVPTATVINLSEVFGAEDATARFVARYLKATHCELFFADAAIFVEGEAERILVPHFIKNKFERLHHRFITLLEIGGSHAHRFQPLVERLGLSTLLICDIDAKDVVSNKAVRPKRGAGQETSNPTLTKWHPKKNLVDELLAVTDADQEIALADGHGCIRVAFQRPGLVQLKDGDPAVECLASTFEDALILENAVSFAKLEGIGMLKKVVDALKAAENADALTETLYAIIRDGKKGEFALDLLWADKPQPPAETMTPPAYIRRGLEWLDEMLAPEEIVLVPVPQAVAP